MDVTGVFGYSDEDGTEAASYDAKLDEDEVRARAEHVTALVEELNAQRAEERIGELVEVLVESLDGRRGAEGRAAHQGPEVDGTHHARDRCRPAPAIGDLVAAVVVATDGVDLVARADRSRAPMTATDRAARQQLQPAERADHPAHRDGAVLRLGAARRRRRLGAVAHASPSRSSRWR